jgi:DNA-binding MarR family transcriptional regulator
MPRKTDSESAALAAAMIDLVRSFGLHRPHETPCGRPIPVGEAHAMMDLAKAGPMNQGELALRLRLEKSTVSRLVRQLEKRGWIHRASQAQDGRVVLLQLTAAGTKAARRQAEARSSKFDRLLEGIPKTKRAQVLAALTTLVRALEEE